MSLEADGRREPQLSVVMTIDSQRNRGELALRAFLAQDLIDEMEILVLELDRGDRNRAPLAGSDHPNVRIVPIDPASGYGQALATGAREARAPIVAFVEEHVQALPGWASALLEAHRGPWAAVCAQMYPGDLGRPAAVGTELVSRHAWSAPAQGGEAELLRWQNVCYKREVLLRYRDRLPLFLQSEGVFFRQLRSDGGRLYIEPAAKVVHAHEVAWTAFLGGTWHSSRVSAASARSLLGGGWEGFWRPLASALIGPARWPAVLYRRTQALPDAGCWTRVFWRSLPLVVLYYSVAAAGSLAGLLLGIGDSSRRFLDYEVNKERLVPELAAFAHGSEPDRIAKMPPSVSHG